MEPNTLVLNLIEILPAWTWLICTIIPMITSEIGVIVLGFFSSQGYFSLAEVIIFGTTGMLITDSIWFFLGKKVALKKAKNSGLLKKFKIKEEHLEKEVSSNDILLIFLAKLLIGTRILIIMYISTRKIKYGKYIMYDFAPTLIWVCSLSILGWISGEGYLIVLSTFQKIQYGITFILAMILIFYLLQKWITKKVTNEIEKK
jgi:membrane protein DedA with SNARE-associated domain